MAKTMPRTIDELTALFERLGAPDPRAWAESQINEGINQLGRFVFLREAWKLALAHDDTSWIERVIAQAKARPTDPGAGIGPAVERMLAAGVDRKDLHEVARVMQWQMLAGLCYLLDDPGELEPEIADLAWSLVQVDGEGAVVDTIGGLHESVLETEPSGREMRPDPPER